MGKDKEEKGASRIKGKMRYKQGSKYEGNLLGNIVIIYSVEVVGMNLLVTPSCQMCGHFHYCHLTHIQESRRWTFGFIQNETVDSQT